MNIALVDDEDEYLNMIIKYCRKFGTQNNLCFELSGFKDGEAFLKDFEKGSYSLVFMDIYMAGMSGIETARRLREKDSECILIFLTSSQDFMPDAFSCHAFEYITKPFTEERVFQVLQDTLKVIHPVSRFIEIVSERKTIPVFLTDVMSAVSDGHYLAIGLTDGTSLRSRMTTGDFLELTGCDSRFLSVNKGIILNADYISKVENNCCILENGDKFPIRIRNRLQIEQAVRDYNFRKIRGTQKQF